jgi:hypothetical protein
MRKFLLATTYLWPTMWHYRHVAIQRWLMQRMGGDA